MNVNIVIVGGRLTRDPQLEQVNGKPRARASMAINRKRKSGDDEVVFLDITLWDSIAESFCRFHKKGSTVLVTGRLYQYDSKTPSGDPIKRLNLVADGWEFGGDADKRPSAQPKPQEDDDLAF